jgi:predicted DNA-binding protein
MTTKRSKANNQTVRARVEPNLKTRLNNFRLNPAIRRSEGFVVREALEEFLNKHETQKLACPEK